MNAMLPTLGGPPASKPHWGPMLDAVAQLHQRSTHAPRAPFRYPWEEIGPGYAATPAFGHWDIVHQILDGLPLDPEHARHQILNNLACQQEDGFLPGTIYMKGAVARWNTIAGHPPVWPVAVQEWTDFTGDTQLLEKCFIPLTKQIGWYEQHRAAQPTGFFYTDILSKLWESGVDEGVRFDWAQPGPYTCVDATAHIYSLYDHATQWAEILGHDASSYRSERDRLRQFLQQDLFDSQTGWFHDIWAIEDPSLRRMALEGMWPMVVGAATPDQASAVVANLLNPDKFFTPHPLSTVARTDPAFELRMWRGPAWNSMTYWAARGCLRYNHFEAANRLLEAALEATARQFERTGKIWEFYHPMGGDWQELSRKPDTEFNSPFSDYLGHNPLQAMARLYESSLLEISSENTDSLRQLSASLSG